MIEGLLDSSVLVDNLRSYPPAVAWLADNRSRLGITWVVRLEIIQGAKDKLSQQRALNLLNDLEHVENTFSDFTWASEQLIRLRLSHNVDAFDCLIAAASHRLSVPLYTINLKHFTPLLEALAQKPY